MKKLGTLIFVLISFAFAFNLVAAGHPPTGKHNKIRVLLFSHSDQLELEVKSSFTVYTQDRRQVRKKMGGGKLVFKKSGEQIYLDNHNLNTDSVYVVPGKDGSLEFKGIFYRGLAKITINPKNKLALINVLDVEDYLKSVVPGEVSAKWPKEVLKAQAVAARTYAYYHMKKAEGSWVDINSPLAQNYQGIKKEHPLTNAAVLSTKAQVLYYHGYIFPAFFHSTCGGGTEFPQNVWSLNFKIPEIVPCDYCKDSPYFKWNKTFTLHSIENKLKNAGIDVLGLQNVYPSKISKNRSHITEIALISQKGEKRLRVNEFRRILGFNELKSSKFKIDKKGENIVFKGWGWGHGVGMCQWGARGLAKENKSYRRILSYYYPGSRIKRVLM